MCRIPISKCRADSHGKLHRGRFPKSDCLFVRGVDARNMSVQQQVPSLLFCRASYHGVFPLNTGLARLLMHSSNLFTNLIMHVVWPGWMRMALLVLYFSPSNLLRPDESFAAVSNRLMVAPVVESLVYSRLPRTVGAAGIKIQHLEFLSNLLLVDVNSDCVPELSA